MVTEIEVDDGNFKEKVIEQSERVPIVVDFWASWCRPCLMLAPILEKLIRDYKGKFILAKYNIEKNPYFTQKYMVMSIPSVKLFKKGKVVDEFVGVLPEQNIRQWLGKNLK